MTLKTKLISLVAMLCLMIGVLLVGIYAAQTQTITMQGSVNFEISDKSLYMKDVRIQMDNNSEPTSIDGFLPGYINGDFNMNLGNLTNTYGSFALYFDIVNTIDEETQESFYYSPSVTCEQTGIQVSVSGAIDKGTVLPDNVATADINGTVKLTVINPTDTPVDLSKITITIYQAEVYTDFVFDDHGMLLSYTGTSTNVTIPSSYAMIGEPTEMTLNLQTEADLSINNLMLVFQMTNFSYVFDGQEIFFEDAIAFNEYLYDVNNGSFQIPCQLIYNDYSDVIFIENNDIITKSIAPLVFVEDSQFTSEILGLESIFIPSGVEEVGMYAFLGCENLSSVVFGENSQLKYIGEDAFTCYDNENLITNIELPKTLTYIGIDAFRNSPLTSVTIPASVTYMGTAAFKGSSEIIFEETTGWYITNVWDTSLEEFDVTNEDNLDWLMNGPFYSEHDDACLVRIA